MRFHINAPFASTVARDSVRNCSDNINLIKNLSLLIVESLPKIKKFGMMNHSFFDVLPNQKDNLSHFYSYIFDYIYSAFQNNEYLPTKDGNYVSADSALIGPAAISNLFKNNDFQFLTGTKKKWILNAPQKNSFADSFIHSLDIETYSYDSFVNLFDFEFRGRLEELIPKKNLDYLKRFYVLCADAYEYLYYYSQKSENFIKNMKDTIIIKSREGELYKATDIFILPKNVQLITKTTPIVDQQIIFTNRKNDRYSKRIKDFFVDELGIIEYGPKVEIENLLKKYTGVFKVDDEYFNDILTFAKYKVNHNDIDFSSKLLFRYSNEFSDITYSAKSDDLVFGNSYGNEFGELLAGIYGKHCLWNGYAKHYTSEEELQQFIKFARSCGVQRELVIEKQSADLNPLFSTELSCFGCRKTGLGSDFDYTIPELEKILKKPSIEIAKLIWITLDRYGKYNGDSYVKARYSPNASATEKSCDSTLIYYLKQYAWIPDKKGEFYKPEDISISELMEGFSYQSNNKLFESLMLGTGNDKKREKREEFERVAKEYGMHYISDEEYKLFERYKAQQKLTSEKRTPMSSKDLLKKQNKNPVHNGNFEDMLSCDGTVDSVSHKETNIESTFLNSKKMKPLQKKLFSRVVESTKEERMTLKKWYNGKCQMCNFRIIKYNKVPYFVARNIINTSDLSTSIRQTTCIAWNSLCLCPNCAAKYNVCARDLNGLYEQIIATKVKEHTSEKIVLTIQLAGKLQKIFYVPEHFLALKKAISLIDSEIK